MLIRSLFIVILLALTAPVWPQAAETETREERRAQVRRDAVVFLRETMGDVASMRSLENRISFTSEMAGLMWFHDEREARNIFTGVTGDFRELAMQFDAQMNAIAAYGGEEEQHTGGLVREISDRSVLLRPGAGSPG